MALKTQFYATGDREYIAQLSYEREGRAGRGYYASICACAVVEMEGFGWSFKTSPFDGTYSGALLLEVRRASDKAAQEAARVFEAWCEAYFDAVGASAYRCTAQEAAEQRRYRMERETAAA